MLDDPYFALRPPKSTGFEYFNLRWLRGFNVGRFDPAEVQATLCELSAASIAGAIAKYAATTREVFVCGGGSHNDELMRRLRRNIPGATVSSTVSVGLDPDWVEAVAFAWLAMRTMRGETGNLAECDRRNPQSGARRYTLSLTMNDLYINRDLSLLEFNRRVLAQAEDPDVPPLLERLRFMCISCTNLGEFFEIRVAGLKQRIEIGALAQGPENRPAVEVFDALRVRVSGMVEQQYKVLNEQLLPQLANAGVRFVRSNEWTAKQRKRLDTYFNEQVDSERNRRTWWCPHCQPGPPRPSS